MLNAGIVLERDTIYDRIWGFDFETNSRSLDVYIGYLRRKTEAGGEPRLVHTVRGVGYVVAGTVSLRWRIALGLAAHRRAGERHRGDRRLRHHLPAARAEHRPVAARDGPRPVVPAPGDDERARRRRRGRVGGCPRPARCNRRQPRRSWPPTAPSPRASPVR